LPDPSDAAIRELARTILARREYGLINQKLDLRWEEWLDRFVNWIGFLRVNSPLLYWVLLAALITIVAVMVAQIVWSVRKVLKTRARTAQAVASARPADLAGEARELADCGRFLDAGHRLMIASFGVLAERSVIELRPDRSNRWIREALRGSPLAEGLGLEIGVLVERTELKWFGSRDNQPDIYYDWSAVYQRLVSLLE
jgi:hypothetical protein